MLINRHRLGARLLAAFALLCALFACRIVAHAAPPVEDPVTGKNILLLYSYGHGSQGVGIFDSGFLQPLSAGGYSTSQLFFEYLDLERNRDDPNYRLRMQDLLDRKYRGRQIDLIVTVQQPALNYLFNEGRGLAEGAPVISVQAPMPSESEVGKRRVVSELASFDFKGTLERALELFPNTRRVVFVSGASEADRNLSKQAASVAQPWQGRLEFEYTTEISLDAMLKRVASLPERTIIIFTQYNRDVSGKVTVAYEVEAAIIKAANAPVFGLYDFNLVNGGIGGSVVGVKSLGESTGMLALELLNGKLQLTQPVTSVGISAIPMFDWEQIKRWDGDASRLSGNPVFVNRVPTFWDLYKLYVLGIAAFIVVQSMLIAILVVNRRRRKVSQQALMKSEARHRAITETAHDAIVTSDSAGNIVGWNQGAQTIFGYTESEIMNRSVAVLMPERYRDQHLVGMKRIDSGGESRVIGKTVQLHGLHKDASEFPLELSLAKWESSEGWFVSGVIRDITDRKQAENALLKSEERWKFAIEGSGDGLWDWNVQTGKAFYSSRFKTMLGFAEDEIGDSQEEWSKRVHPDDAPGAFASMQRYVDGKADSGTIEYRMLCKDGSWQWTMGRGMVVERSAQGKALRLIGTISDITERKQHQSQLEHIAHFDALTSLPNRVLLSDRLQQAMAQALRRNQQLAVVYLDLDGFKAINDQHGHDAGDQVLITLAERMKQVLREGDSLARLGGDEFVAVLIDLEDLAASRPMLTRLLAACAQQVRVGDLSLQVSASLGVTAYPQPQDIDADQLLRQADQAMYQAKLAGKNRYHIFDATLDSSIRGHHESVERIRLALEMHEFVMHYQPKVNMRSGQIIGAEALIRWQHPEKGLLAPALFLPVIEDHALAVFIGEWVIDTALTQIELWRSAGLDMKVSVNIGARQLQQSDFVERLKSILAKHPQVKPAHLELEVLETSALEDIAQVSDVIEACAQIGVTFALDDFGTGYSSLTYLKRLRVAMLKIDQSFVRDMLEDPADWAILQGIIGLATAFKQDVIAEGVETIEHGSLLLQLGCILAQGYGIARPMPAAQMPQWAAQWQPDAAWDSVWDNIKAGKGLNGIERRSKENERRIVVE